MQFAQGHRFAKLPDPGGSQDQDESLSFVRWFLFLFRLEREAGKEDGNMFPI